MFFPGEVKDGGKSQGMTLYSWEYHDRGQCDLPLVGVVTVPLCQMTSKASVLAIPLQPGKREMARCRCCS